MTGFEAEHADRADSGTAVAAAKGKGEFIRGIPGEQGRDEPERRSLDLGWLKPVPALLCLSLGRSPGVARRPRLHHLGLDACTELTMTLKVQVPRANNGRNPGSAKNLLTAQ